MAPIIAPFRSSLRIRFKIALLVLPRTLTPAHTNTMRHFCKFSGSVLVCTATPLLAILLTPLGLATIHSKIGLPLCRLAARNGSMAEANASNENSLSNRKPIFCAFVSASLFSKCFIVLLSICFSSASAVKRRSFYLSLSVNFSEMKQKKCTYDEFFVGGWSCSAVALRPVVAFWCQIVAKFAITLPR